MKKIFTFILLAIFFIVNFSVQAQNKKYAIKSGKVNYQMNMGGLSLNSTLYFEDYGAKECNEVSVDIQGQKGHSRNFNADGYMYSVDMVQKSYTKTEYTTPIFDYSKMNFEQLAKTDPNVKIEGNEDFLGKKCTLYTMTKEGLNSKFWVWNNIVFKMIATTAAGTVSLIGTEFNETSTLKSKNANDNVFSIPEGFVEKALKK